MTTWLKNCGKTLYRHRGVVLDIVAIAATIIIVLAYFALLRDTAYWKSIATTPEPELCSLCEDGKGVRYHAPALINLSTGAVWELEIYDNDPRRPWEIAEEQQWNDGVFRFLDGNAAMSWSSVDHINIATIGDDLGKFDPTHFCHDCRALLAETATKGYALLDLYNLENIQAFTVEDGKEYTIRDYTVSIYKNKDTDELNIEVNGHLFGAE